MKRVYILVFSKAVENKYFSSSKSNPGIGGTQFTSILLALALSEQCPHWDIILVNNAEILFDNSLPNLKQEFHKSPAAFFESLSRNKQKVIISSRSVLSKVSTELLRKFEDEILCTSRHPFDSGIKELVNRKVNLRAIVCVGTYQFHSNTSNRINCYHIQNIFSPPKLQTASNLPLVNQTDINALHLGALVPGKGFLDVAKSWVELKTKIPGIKLNVIGSSETYGIKPESDLVPAELGYAKQILKFIPEEDIHSGKVVFHGNLGQEKFDLIKKANLAILNPTGATEAFPASPLECMSCGVPVIASDDFGMSDSMRFFPELIVKGHKNIAEKTAWLLSDPLRYREMQLRSLAIAQWFASQTDLVVNRWIRLINCIFEHDDNHISLFPLLPFYGSRTKFLYRKHINSRTKLLSKLKKILTNM